MRQFVTILAVCGIIGITGAAIPTAGLQLHLDASSLTGYSNGATVSTWPDLSGNGNDAISTGTPTYVANALNGHPAVRIVGSADLNANWNYESDGVTREHDNFFGLSNTVHNVKTVAMVFKRTTNVYYSWAPILGGVAGTNPFHGDATYGTAYWNSWADSSVRFGDLRINGVSKGYLGGEYTSVPTEYHIMTLVLQNGWGSDVTIEEIARSPNYTVYSVYGMDIAELLVYDQYLGASDIADLELELSHKYGFGSVIPLHPTKGQANIPVNDDLSWQAYDASWGVDVYLDPNETNVATGKASAKIVSNQAVSMADPGTLDFATTYYWRVDVYEPNTVGYIFHEGPVWSFTTLPPNPLITMQPVSQTVTAGSAVSLTVAGENIDSYQWYLNGTPVSGGTSATLSIPSLNLANEGLYTCVAMNPSGSDTSAPAIVVSKRLMGWWKLDGNLNDSVATAVPGALAHNGSISNPNFVAGIDNDAYEFLRYDSRIISIADSNDYFNFYPQGLTVSAWIKTSQGGWGGFVAKNNSDNSAGFYLEHESDNWIVTGFRGIDGQWYEAAEGEIYDSWHHVTLTLDGPTKTVKQYIDGRMREEAQYTVTLPLSSEKLFFGAELADGTFSYDGLLDDVRIWSYPLDAVAIAQLYYDLTGTPVCIDYPVFDLTGPNSEPDCRVNLLDFAAMGVEWLECNIVPTCIN